MQKQISGLFEKEMTRKEFLATLGFGVASIMGVSSLVKLATGKSFSSSRQVADGYGSSAYGGDEHQ